MPTDKELEGFEMYYTATLVNDEYVDEILGFGEEIQAYLEGRVTNIDLSNTVVEVDLPEDMGTNNLLTGTSDELKASYL